MVTRMHHAKTKMRNIDAEKMLLCVCVCVRGLRTANSPGPASECDANGMGMVGLGKWFVCVYLCG